jgi:hypothetical protein
MVSIPRYLAIKLARKTLNAIEDEAGKNKYDKKTHSLGFVHQAIKDTVEKIFTGDSDEESLRRILEEADNYHAMNEAVFPSEIISIEEPYCYAKRILEEDENKRRERTKELQNEIDEMIVVDRTEIGGTDWETGNR